MLTNKYAGMKIPEAVRAPARCKRFLEGEKALTPENVAATERFAAWVAKRGIGTPAQVALAWVLRRSEVSSAIIGASSVEQLEENLKAADVKLDDADWREAERVTRGAPAPRRASPKPRSKRR